MTSECGCGDQGPCQYHAYFQDGYDEGYAQAEAFWKARYDKAQDALKSRSIRLRDLGHERRLWRRLAIQYSESVDAMAAKDHEKFQVHCQRVAEAWAELAKIGKKP